MENKKDYILQLIEKGYSEEHVEILADAKFPAPTPDVEPAAPSTITPQEAIDGLCDAVTKVNEVKLNKSGIAFYKGETRIFNTEKVAPSKFADTTLFDKVVLPALTIPAKDVVVGFATITNDKSVQAPAGTKFGPVVFGAGQNSHGAYDAYIGTATNIKSGNIDNGYSNRGSFSISDTTASLTKQGGDTYNSAISVSIIETIPAQVIRATTEYKYIAKKDITHADMGEN